MHLRNVFHLSAIFVFVFLKINLARAAPPSNSDCVKWCASNFANAGATCTSQAAHATGPCFTCGPKKTITSEKLCNGVCTNTASDKDNCNSCGNTCDLGFTCCSSSCANLLTDNSNCGLCGIVCPTGQICSNGACIRISNSCSCPPADNDGFVLVQSGEENGFLLYFM